MDFLTRKDYTDNWLSETHEQFCGLDFADWTALLDRRRLRDRRRVGAWRNDWIVDNRLAPGRRADRPGRHPLDWPDTHVLLVARRPLNT